jgi:hypothetical protein
VHSVRVPAVLAAFLLVTGCAPGEEDADDRPTGGVGGAPATATAASPSPTPTGEGTDSAARTVRVQVRDGEVTPPARRVQVALGAQVRLEVTSDVADEVHVHGYDEDLALAPGETGALTFAADLPGLFEVETHESGTLLATLEVR